MVLRHTPMCIDAWWLWGACVWVEMASEARWHARHFSHIGRCVISPDSHVDILADMYTWFHMCELDSFLHSVYAIIWYVAGASAAMFHLHGFTMTQAGSGATMLERRQWSGKTIIYIIKWYLQYHWKSCPMWQIWHVPVCRLHMIWHGFLSNKELTIKCQLKCPRTVWTSCIPHREVSIVPRPHETTHKVWQRNAFLQPWRRWKDCEHKFKSETHTFQACCTKCWTMSVWTYPTKSEPNRSENASKIAPL